MEIKKAVRKATPFIGCLYGRSSSGKTFSAIRLAKGLAPHGKICIIDTENGRASHYADHFEFDTIELSPPFTPARYIEAVKMVVKAGYEVIIIDSISHEWDGLGGCLEIADEVAENQRKKGLSDKGLNIWAKPKAEHRKLMNVLLNLNVHVIFCARGKEKLKSIIDENGRTKIVNEGMNPIQEANFPFEVLVTFHLEDQGKAFLEKATDLDILRKNFKDGSQITEEHGKIIAEHINKGQEVDIETKRLKEEARQIAMEGEAVLKTWFEGLEKEDKEIAEKFPMEFKKELVKIATDHDNSSTMPININEIIKKAT